MVEEKAIEPHMPLWDKGERDDGTFSRSDFVFDAGSNTFTCPGGTRLQQYRYRNFAQERSGITKANSLADLRTVVDAIYASPQWHAALARDLKTTPRTVKGWFARKRLPDLRKQLADLCRRNGADDPNMERLVRKLEKLGPPEQ
jgi:hypothetical protein